MEQQQAGPRWPVCRSTVAGVRVSGLRILPLRSAGDKVTVLSEERPGNRAFYVKVRNIKSILTVGFDRLDVFQH